LHRFATGIFRRAKTLFVELRDETEDQMIAAPVCTGCADKHRDEIIEHASQHIFNDSVRNIRGEEAKTKSRRCNETGAAIISLREL
jgi:hypothetical protein